MGGSPPSMSSSELRRDVSVWGSYMWGYADVGADIYTALGIVTLAALGLTPLAFLMAGTVYALVGLCYAELASAYPVAGGGQYFTLRGLGVITIVAQSLIVIAGFVFVWNPGLLAHQFVFNRPSLGQFAFGTSLAIISFVGLESISQVAQETRRPATIIPRTTIGLILSVLLFAIAFSILATGMVDASAFKGHEGDPVALIAGRIPFIGAVAAPLTALIGGIVVYISANSGVVSVSRLTYSMSQFQLIPSWFNQVHARYKTPIRTIVVFSGAALLITVFAFIFPGKPGSNAAIDILADMYAFGATYGYLLVFASLFVLRFKDPYTPRPYRMPLNIQVRYRGQPVWLPVLGIIGFVGVLFFLIMVVATHAYARIAGPVWVLLAFLLYALYRRRRKLPVLHSPARDWEMVQRHVLESAEEWKSLEEYEAALTQRDLTVPRGVR